MNFRVQAKSGMFTFSIAVNEHKVSAKVCSIGLHEGSDLTIGHP